MAEETSEEYQERLRAVKQAFVNVFSSPDGKKVLEQLKKEFDPDTLHVEGDTHATYINLGRRDVVIFIEEVINER
jgi:hypothetical protein